MPITLSQLEKELARKRIEVSDLETAIRVLLRLEAVSANGHHSETPQPVNAPESTPRVVASDLAGKTIAQCAEIILSENSEPLHYSDVAAEALRRGYKSQKSGDEAANTQSFWATMNREKGIFQAAGKGKYQLIPKQLPVESPSPRRGLL